MRSLENIADLGFEGGLKMLSIPVNLIESTQIVSPAVDSTCRKLIAPLDNVGWDRNIVVSTRFDQIDTNRTNRLTFVATF